MTMIRKAIVVLVLVSALLGGLAATAGAGEWCVRIRPGQPLNPLTACVPTNY